MMGRQTTPERLFYDFCLEDHVPADHLLRQIDGVLALNELRDQLKPFYSVIGRPSVDPELMVRMLLVGYCFGIRSERRLCQEVHLNLAYRWFCRLDLTDTVPPAWSSTVNDHAPGWPLVPGEATPRVGVQEVVAGGQSNKQIARALNISDSTVKAHVGSIFQRIGVTDTAFVRAITTLSLTSGCRLRCAAR